MDLEEQKRRLQDFLNMEFERKGWNNGSIAWQDVAKRKFDLSNSDIFQASHKRPLWSHTGAYLGRTANTGGEGLRYPSCIRSTL